MLLTLNLSATDTRRWHLADERASIVDAARRLSVLQGRRFAQIVSYAGRILHVLEVQL